MFKKSVSLVLIVVVIFLTFSGCQKKPAEDSNGKGYEASVIRVNSSNLYTACIQDVIRYKNLLEPHLPEDVTVEWTNLPTGPDIRDALLAGKTDIAGFSASTFISALENGAPLVLLSSAAGAPVLLFSKNPNIKSLEDIDSSTRVGVSAKSTSAHIAFMAGCKERFDDPLIFDSNLVPIAYADMLASLAASDDLDCAILIFPNTVKADEIEGLEKIEDFSPLVGAYDIGSYTASNQEFYEKNPVLVDAYIKAQKEAVDFMRNNPKEAAELLSTVYELDPQNIQSVIETFPPSMEIDGYDKLAGLLYDAGILANPPKKFADLPNYETIPKK